MAVFLLVFLFSFSVPWVYKSLMYFCVCVCVCGGGGGGGGGGTPYRTCP